MKQTGKSDVYWNFYAENVIVLTNSMNYKYFACKSKAYGLSVGAIILL